MELMTREILTELLSPVQLCAKMHGKKNEVSGIQGGIKNSGRGRCSAL
jgi:hypothetical protein